MKKNQSNYHNQTFDIDHLLECYALYLQNTRGLAPRTITEYAKEVEYFLKACSKKNKINFQHIQPSFVIHFILECGHNKGASRAQHLTYPLRSFFRFVKQNQLCKRDLANVVPTVANRKKNSYPQVLSTEEIDKLLQTCNRHEKAGIRNYAILILMVKLGLRSSEVCNLNLNDFDWNKGEMIIRGKGSEARFPIFEEVGRSLIRYLRYSRPPCKCNKFFIRLRRPLKGFTTGCIRGILRAALSLADLHPKITGAHLLRHSFAMHLLEQGASLTEIGTVLRHRDIGSTAIYARTNFDKLRTIVLPWPQQMRKGVNHG